MGTNFRNGQGKYMAIDDIELFLTLLDNPDPEVWIGQTGSCGLWRTSDEAKKQLMIISFVPKIGFAISCEDMDGRAYAAWDGPGKKQITFYVGGEAEVLEQRFFLPASLAKEIARQFILFGTRYLQVEWIRSRL